MLKETKNTMVLFSMVLADEALKITCNVTYEIYMGNKNKVTFETEHEGSTVFSSYVGVVLGEKIPYGKLQEIAHLCLNFTCNHPDDHDCFDYKRDDLDYMAWLDEHGEYLDIYENDFQERQQEFFDYGAQHKSPYYLPNMGVISVLVDKR